MELGQDAVDYDVIISSLVAKNAEHELRIATLKARVAALSKELDVVQQMQASQHITPDVAELLAKLDIK